MDILKKYWILLLAGAVALTLAILIAFSPTWQHIAYRNFVLHLPWAILFQRMSYYGLRYLQRRLRGSKSLFYTEKDIPVLIASAILPVLLTFWREPGDVEAGDLAIKSTVDSIFWLVCGGIGAYDHYRAKYKD